jgi:hypothetical protein
MKKKKLIELLEKIPGNPNIVVWNGFVGDYMDISDKYVETYMVKECRESARQMIQLRCERDGQTFTEEYFEECYKCREWGLPNQFIESEEEFKRWYGKNKKTLVILDLKARGKSCFDRLGTINY